MTPDVELRDLTVRYAATTGLDGVSLRLAGGKIHGLLGRNGSGKTSLLSVLAAFRRPTAGTILVGGRPVWERRDATRQICLIRDSGADLGDHGDRVSEALDVARHLRPNWDAGYARRLVERFRIPVHAKLGECRAVSAPPWAAPSAWRRARR